MLSAFELDKWIMNRKTLLENDDLIELIFKCLEFNPRDRMRKENLMKNRFFYTEYSETEKKSLTQNSETRPDPGEEEFQLSTDNVSLLTPIITQIKGKKNLLYEMIHRYIYT